MMFFFYIVEIDIKLVIFKRFYLFVNEIKYNFVLKFIFLNIVLYNIFVDLNIFCNNLEI